MTDTVRIAAPKGEWTAIAEGPLTDCLVTPTREGFYLYSTAEPTWDSGHGIGAFENVNAVPEDDSSFWYLSPSDDAYVYKSERTPA